MFIDEDEKTNDDLMLEVLGNNNLTPEDKLKLIKNLKSNIIDEGLKDGEELLTEGD